MLKLTKDIEGSKITEVKFDLKNFGADKVYVIHDPKKTQRRKDFESAWNNFTGLNYTYIDAITPEDFDLDRLITTGKHNNLTINDTWYDIGDLCLTYPILSIAYSHMKVYEQILKDNVDGKSYSRVLVLEDDARPTKGLMEAIYTGEYKNYIEQLKRMNFNWIYLGTADNIIRGQMHNELFKIPETYTGLAAHAVLYDVDNSIHNIFHYNKNIWTAADLLLHYLQDTNQAKYIFAPHISWIAQQWKQYGEFMLEPDDPDFEYSTGSQINQFVGGGTKEYPYLCEKLAKKVDVFPHRDERPNFITAKWKAKDNRFLH